MAKIPVMPVGGESGGVVCGSYTGEANGDKRKGSKTVPLGCTPKALVLIPDNGNRVSGLSYMEHRELLILEQGKTVSFGENTSSAETVGCLGDCLALTWDMGYGSVYWSSGGQRYFYIAFR